MLYIYGTRIWEYEEYKSTTVVQEYEVLLYHYSGTLQYLWLSFSSISNMRMNSMLDTFRTPTLFIFFFLYYKWSRWRQRMRKKLIIRIHCFLWKASYQNCTWKSHFWHSECTICWSPIPVTAGLVAMCTRCGKDTWCLSPASQSEFAFWRHLSLHWWIHPDEIAREGRQ